MSKRYNYEFKKQIVTLVNNGKGPNEILMLAGSEILVL